MLEATCGFVRAGWHSTPVSFSNACAGDFTLKRSWRCDAGQMNTLRGNNSVRCELPVLSAEAVGVERDACLGNTFRENYRARKVTFGVVCVASETRVVFGFIFSARSVCERLLCGSGGGL